MKLTIKNAEAADINPASQGNRFNVNIEGIKAGDLLFQVNIDDAIRYYGITELLDAIGEQEVRSYMDGKDGAYALKGMNRDSRPLGSRMKIIHGGPADVADITTEPKHVARQKGLNGSKSFSEVLIAILVHDLRQPFAALLSISDMIRNGNRPLSVDELHRIIDEMYLTSSKSIGLLNGLVSWMKSGRAGQPDQLKPLRLRELIDEAGNWTVRDQRNKGVTISNSIPEGQLIHANSVMLQFINRNLLGNAIKYSRAGGVVNIDCSIGDDGITVAFRDEGVGIKEENLERIFNIHGSEMSDADPLGGAGIALSICRDMITIMDGKLWAESVFGHGATFFYSLPAGN